MKKLIYFGLISISLFMVVGCKSSIDKKMDCLNGREAGFVRVERESNIVDNYYEVSGEKKVEGWLPYNEHMKEIVYSDKQGECYYIAVGESLVAGRDINLILVNVRTKEEVLSMFDIEYTDLGNCDEVSGYYPGHGKEEKRANCNNFSEVVGELKGG